MQDDQFAVLSFLHTHAHKHTQQEQQGHPADMACSNLSQQAARCACCCGVRGAVRVPASPAAA
jgi:hypothetical protein